jgi:TRAP-type C4-dicarboxylate transport system permease large subunit
MLPEISLATIFRGVMPFIAADIVRVSVIVFVPALSLVLPRLME